jgi:hypothetical protein
MVQVAGLSASYSRLALFNIDTVLPVYLVRIFPAENAGSFEYAIGRKTLNKIIDPGV